MHIANQLLKMFVHSELLVFFNSKPLADCIVKFFPNIMLNHSLRLDPFEVSHEVENHCGQSCCKDNHEFIKEQINS